MHLYPTQTTAFGAGDMLLLYSRMALTETPNSMGECIKQEQIITLLEGHPAISSATMKDVLLDYFQRHAGSNLRDDLTVVLCTR